LFLTKNNPEIIFAKKYNAPVRVHGTGLAGQTIRHMALAFKRLTCLLMEAMVDGAAPHPLKTL
jgi:hypothetical protein